MRLSPSGFRTAKSNLEKIGLLVSTKQRKPTRGGNDAFVIRARSETDWRASEQYSSLTVDDVVGIKKAHARRTDPQTSHDAARSIKHLNKSMKVVYEIFRKNGPMITEKAYEILEMGWQDSLL